MKFFKILFQFRSEYFLLFLPLNPQRPRKKKKKIQDSPSRKITPPWSFFVIIPFISAYPRFARPPSLPPSCLDFLKKKKKEEKNPPASVVWFTLKKAFVKAGAWINLKAGRGPGCSHLSGLALHPVKIAKWCFSFQFRSDAHGCKKAIRLDRNDPLYRFVCERDANIHVSPTPIISFHEESNDVVVIAVVSRVAILCRFFPSAPAFSPRVILSGGKETRGWYTLRY